ncbi:MAG: winged helix-turn-helix transcriptional regulator [Methanobrevibacter sp.]|jgi:putative transcriptional regulator|nr:winged helix-turn-helix transcriptional regulator [Methanobrevibacter sp.]
MKVFRERGELTRFQILYEISKREPNLRQTIIAERLGLTIQAISENIKQLIKEGYITAGKNGRSPYSVTLKGISRVKHEANILKNYTDEIFNTMNYYKSIWPAIASEKLKKGELVGLYMDNSVLYAGKKEQNATALTLTSASENDDVGLTNLSGTIEIKTGQVVIISLPTIKEGGSRASDLKLIKRTYKSGLKTWGLDEKFDRIGVLGTTAYSASLKLSIPIDFEFAVSKSTISATIKGLNVLIITVGKMAESVIEKLETNGIKFYRLNAHIS